METNKNQTAVDWLIEQLIRLDKELDGRRKNEDSTVFKLLPHKIYEEAKEIEKEHMFDSFQSGWRDNYSKADILCLFEEYYKEKYGE